MPDEIRPAIAKVAEVAADAGHSRHRHVCAVCGDEFSSVRAVLPVPVCSETCRSTLAYWRSRGLARLRIRVRLFARHQRALERIVSILELHEESA